MARSHLVAYCKHCRGLGQREKGYVHMHVHTSNGLIQNSNGKLSYIFIVRVLEEIVCNQLAHPKLTSLTLRGLLDTGLSHLLQVDHPFSPHQHCFGSKLSSWMGAVVHAEKNWKNMNGSFNLLDKFATLRSPKT